MTKVKKDKKIVKSPTQKVKKINNKQLKKKPIEKKSKELKKKLTKTLVTSSDENNSTNVLSKVILNCDKLNIDFNQIRKGVEALLQYTEKHKSKDLFKGQQQIFVQITCIRIPTGASKKFRIKLQHPLISIDNEICLIVPDLQRGRKVEHDETVEFYENLLRSKNVNYIKRILPIRQLRVEYDQFELKRRLCGYYDYFLVDGRISGHALHILGKTFNDKRKLPVPIQMGSENLNDVILKAMSKTELNVHSNGDSYIVQIGHTDMPIEHIVDNLKVIINSLNLHFPGGWQNIRALHVKTDKSIAIPVYFTLKDANKVMAPKVKVEKVGEVVTDELTTRRHTVTVHPDGRVILNDPVSQRKLKQLKKLKINAKKNGTPQKTKNGKIKKNKKAKKNLSKKSTSPAKDKAEKSPKKIKTESNGNVKTEPKTVVKVKKESVSPIKVKIEKK